VYKPTVTEADLERLKEERANADRLYNEALTALDQAITRPRTLPGSGAPPDTSQLERLNRLWSVLPADPVPFTGWRRRLGAFVWRMLGPSLQRQQEFNAALVEHANRTAASAAEASAEVGTLSSAAGEEFRALAHLQSRLIAYLQQVTLFVDTKDRLAVGEARWEMEHRAAGLAAGLSAVNDELMKRWEAVLVREKRVEARLAEIRASVRRANPGPGDRELGLQPESTPTPAGPPCTPSPSPPATAVPANTPAPLAALASTAEHSAIYAGFEDEFRGSPETIRERLAEYLPLFAGCDTVVEVGCGRGEFLELLRDHGIRGRGADLNSEMVSRCRARGLEVVQADALEYLAAAPDSSIGGLFAAQVVEHLQPDRLLQLLALAHRKLRPGGRIVLETVNAGCWYAFFSSYVRDITHERPLHPETLRYLLTASGFEDADIRYSSAYPKDYKLHPLPQTVRAGGAAFAEVVDEFNGNVEKLNELLFTYLDFAAIAVKPAQ
jgi:SAM-dependent methyltransferase